MKTTRKKHLTLVDVFGTDNIDNLDYNSSSFLRSPYTCCQFHDADSPSTETCKEEAAEK